ncbi:hypothetical protein GYA27_02260 [candidate division WWE3 bacterium]|uniref:Uncharacterized protein n=1 Tax=candidate division WWE3 bacterium TaxID=2053526 RepID=A0A7X9DK73_UNCKA|nr:hypothetical protein [candidate division WWE3 bacterium]
MEDKKPQTRNDVKTLMGVSWAEIIKPALCTTGIAFMILTVALPFLLQKHMAWIMSPFTLVAWAFTLMTTDSIQRQRVGRRILCGSLTDRIILVLDVIYTVLLIGFVVIYYIVDWPK